MEITEAWLGKIGGWAALKSARSLADAGLATLTQQEGPLIRGSAGAGKIKFACGLRIRTASDVDNLCTCPTARRGLICEHSLAVALVGIRGPAKGSNPATPATAIPGKSAPAVAPPAVEPPRSISGQYSIYLPEKLREPLGVLLRHEPIGAETSPLITWLAGQGITRPQTMPLSLRGKALEAFLTALGGHPRVFMGKPSPDAPSARIEPEPLRLPIIVEASSTDQITLQIPDGAAQPIAGSWWWCPGTAVLFRLPPISGLESLWQDLGSDNHGKPVTRPIRWLVAEREKLDTACQVELRGSVLAGFHIAPVPCQYEIHLEGSFQALEARLWGNYEGNKWPIHPPGTLDSHPQAVFPLQDKQKTACFYVRDSSAERELIKRLERYKFESSSGFWQLRKPDEILTFYSQGLSKFPENVTIIKGERWAHVTRNTFHIAPNLKPEKRYTNDQGGTGNDWLSMEFAYEAPDGFRLARTEVLRLIRSGQRQINGRNGQKYILNNESIEELEESLRDVPVQMTPEGVRIHAAHADYFQSGSAVSLVLPAMEQIRSSLGPLADILRDYQLEGIRWLVARTQAGRGGILADDMGLGKTLQTIATILSTGPERGPVMVICPKSLLGNWEAEFARFTPALRVLKIDGTGREKHFAKISAHDVILTSYPLMHRDLDSYATHDFRLIFLDEASFIKNPDTDASKAVRKLRAGARFALTGTPLENGVRDLWSIMSFALPGYLGSRENFKERFEQPVTSHLNAPAGQQAAERLRRLLKPWFLRRTKRQVLRELPEKIEQVLWCDPSPAQAEVYRRILEEGREEIKAARRRSGQNGSRMTMFTVLLRLRQVCCDLRLAKLPEETIKVLQNDDLSGKWSALLDRLDSVIETGGKVLVFSQFVEFLRFMREQLLLRKIDFCYLDGQSNDRADQVISFQTQAEKRVFLISLKAGGYGLNLTAADHVILADPWWNPAVESQAIDRAHRLGQQRVVNAYRLIVRGTVEERILALQAKKRGLVEATLEEDFGTGAGLSDSEMEELLG